MFTKERHSDGQCCDVMVSSSLFAGWRARELTGATYWREMEPAVLELGKSFSVFLSLSNSGCPQISVLSALSGDRVLSLKRWLFCVRTFVCGQAPWFLKCIDPCVCGCTNVRFLTDPPEIS